MSGREGRGGDGLTAVATARNINVNDVEEGGGGGAPLNRADVATFRLFSKPAANRLSIYL